MVDIIGELLFEAYLILLFAEGGLMLAVSFGDGLLERGIQTHDMSGDIAQLIVAERASIIDRFATFGIGGKFAKARDMMSDLASGDISEHAHDQRDASDHPEESIVSLEQRRERHAIGDGGAYHDAILAAARGIEIT